MRTLHNHWLIKNRMAGIQLHDRIFLECAEENISAEIKRMSLVHSEKKLVVGNLTTCWIQSNDLTFYLGILILVPLIDLMVIVRCLTVQSLFTQSMYTQNKKLVEIGQDWSTLVKRCVWSRWLGWPISKGSSSGHLTSFVN